MRQKLTVKLHVRRGDEVAEIPDAKMEVFLDVVSHRREGRYLALSMDVLQDVLRTLPGLSGGEELVMLVEVSDRTPNRQTGVTP